MNLRNYGVASGRITRDPQVLINKDGSNKVLFTVAAQDNFRDREGKKNSQFISFEAFVSANNGGLGVYEHIHKGDMISVLYTAKSNKYTDKTTGQDVYKMVLVPEAIDLLESKAVTEQRAAKNAALAGPAPVPAASAEEDAPFEQ